jgi:AcrR family transcriptional regulator
MRKRYKNPEERKQQILKIARKLINEVSYENFRLETLLTQLELSKGGFYHHFKSTTELLEGLIREDVKAHIASMKSTENTEKALDGLIQMLQSGSQHLGSSQGILSNIRQMDGRRLYVEILEQTFDKPMTELVRLNFERGIDNKEYLPHDSKNAANLFIAANSYGNRRLILGDWEANHNLDFSLFSLQLLSDVLGVGNRLIEIFPSLQ